MVGNDHVRSTRSLMTVSASDHNACIVLFFEKQLEIIEITMKKKDIAVDIAITFSEVKLISVPCYFVAKAFEHKNYKPISLI